jgi:chemotaxis protein MotB
MSASHNEKPPIIIVKRHADHDDSHGGQWKVAYADFVTAMMAFFLIMWLLASTTQSERAAIAKYFTTTTLFALTAGNGVMNGGQSVMNGADAKMERLSPRSQDSKRGRHDDGNDRSTAAPEASRDRIERQRFEALKAELERLMRQGELRALADNLAIEMTPEGLRIQIFDRDGAPMFAPGEAAPTPRLAAILRVIAEVLATVQNPVILTGHTDAQAMQRGGYSNWELSADRANAARRQLEADGLVGNRILSVEGRAATDPLLPESPLAPRNRRIAVTVLRNAVAVARREGRPPDDAPTPPPGYLAP